LWVYFYRGDGEHFRFSKYEYEPDLHFAGSYE